MSIDVLGIVAPHPPIMVPAVGGVDAAATEVSALALSHARRAIEAFAPDALVIMSPHAPGFSDAFAVSIADRAHGDLSPFLAPAARLDARVDRALAAEVFERALQAGLPAVARDATSGTVDLDHGVLVPLTFLDPSGSLPLVVLSLSFLPYTSHRRFGMVVRDAAAALGRRVVFVASGDCSHRLTHRAPAGFSERAHLFDQRLVELLSVGDFEGLMTIEPALVEEAGECGLRSFISLGGFLAGSAVASRLVSYEAPWGVGYLTAVFGDAGLLEGAFGSLDDRPAAARGPGPAQGGVAPTPPTGAKGGSKGGDASDIVRLARETIESYVRDGRVPPVRPMDDPGLPTRAGAFVSLHEHGLLRGCIGTISPTRDTLAAEVVGNAVEAATRDPRFPPVTADELDDLEIKVDVLHEAEPVSGLDDLDPKTYGVIVSCGSRRGLLLPDLEGVDTPEHQVSIAASKGGIAISEPFRLERFKVDRYA
jgi:AmmeMemoRadiSam system protein A